MPSLESYRKNYRPQVPRSLADLSTLTFKESGSSPPCIPEIAELMPHLCGKAIYRPETSGFVERKASRVGVVLSGGQAAGGHNVITGLYDALKILSQESRLIGFLGGPAGIAENRSVELVDEIIDSYRNLGGFDMIGSGRTKIETKEQFEAAKISMQHHRLDGLVIIGGDDSNTNAALLAEYFLREGVGTRVVGIPKTIDGDLKNCYIETSFGFDSATKSYSEIIGNIARDSLSAGKYYFFIKIMGRSASHVALECALKTHPNYTIIGEEIAEKKMSLKEIVEEIADMITQRAAAGKEHGILLIPEGSIEFIPECNELIRQLNDLLATKSDLTGEEIADRLSLEARACYQTLPADIQKQLILDRDPHGNVQVSKIETERLFIDLVKGELKRRKKEKRYSGKFSAQPFFCGYEGRSCLPSNFDANYCYALGRAAALLIDAGATGVMSCLQNLAAPASEWLPLGIPIAAMMAMERRKGKYVPVIKKALVDLHGAPFSKLLEKREEWKIEDDYLYPGPIQFFGPEEISESITITLEKEMGAAAAHQRV